MITPAEFPYITSIYVNDCYAYQNFNIDLVKHQPFSHLILTGKNGSGKSTILRNIHKHIENALFGKDISSELIKLKQFLEFNRANNQPVEDLEIRIKKHYQDIIPNYSGIFFPFFTDRRKEVIYSFFISNRNTKDLTPVTSPTKGSFNTYLDNPDSTGVFVKKFKQFLVNKKVNQAFAQLDSDKEEILKIDTFFKSIEGIFSEILEDKQLKLRFEKDSYDFFIDLSDGRKLTFDILPDGFSAFLSILMDLFVRLDLIRKNVENFTYDPCGIVLIDEPETHLHLSLQYQVLPILTKLFPNVQFIVATHSPAVISSIKNVTVFDLTSKEVMSDEAVGKSFSELMVSHFGLDNEFSSITDEIFDEFNTVLKEYRKNIPMRNEKIKQLMQKHGQYISPTMSLELEAMLSESE